MKENETIVLNANEASIFSHFDEAWDFRDEIDDSISVSTISIFEHDPKDLNDIWVNG